MVRLASRGVPELKYIVHSRTLVDKQRYFIGFLKSGQWKGRFEPTRATRFDTREEAERIVHGIRAMWPLSIPGIETVDC
jgi:hypothetical protein